MKKACTKCGEEKEEWRFYKKGDRRQSVCKKCRAAMDKIYRRSNKDRLSAQGKEYYLDNQGRMLTRNREYRRTNRDELLARRREHRINNRGSILASEKDRRLNTKNEAFEKYGGYRCAECGISDPDVLTLDHIDPGTVVRRNGRREGGNDLYIRLRMDGYPKGYQVLCYNCNIKKHLEYERSKLVEG